MKKVYILREGSQIPLKVEYKGYGFLLSKEEEKQNLFKLVVREFRQL